MDTMGSAQLRTIRDLPLLSEEEFQTLIKSRDEGDTSAVHTIAIHNMRLGYSQVAKTIAQMSFNKIGDVDADDVWQEVYLSLLDAAKSYDPKRSGKFSTFAYQYIGNKCFSLLHKWRRHSKSHPGTLIDSEEMIKKTATKSPVTDVIEEEADTTQLYQELNRALHNLDELEYMTLSLIYGVGAAPLTYKDAAEALGISRSTLMGSLHKGFRGIRQLVLTRTKHGEPEYPCLLEYWREMDRDSLAKALTPLLIEDGSEDEIDELWNEMWEE